MLPQTNPDPNIDPSIYQKMDSSGKLLANLLNFGRLLRDLGLRVSTRQIYDLARALCLIDISRRDDFYHASCGFLVHCADDLDLFQRAFDLFWSGKFDALLEFGFAQQSKSPQPGLPEADLPIQQGKTSPPSAGDEHNKDPRQAAELHFSPTYSPIEILYNKDFSEYNDEELLQAKRWIQNLVWQLDQRRSRRQVRALKRADSLDLPRTIHLSMKQGGEIIQLPWRRRKLKHRPLVVICDISGSMERYSRLFLHFMYSLVQGVRQAEVFVFGTRLTRLTTALRHSDVDTALAKMSTLVLDWSGGTRIGESLKNFNYNWLRRVHGRGALVVIVSDGWDRGDINLLETEISRLHRSVYSLVWLNPLLGNPDYQPLVRGIRTILPHVDAFLPLYNLASLQQLATYFTDLD
jgi:uncharacterized protein with von Willebrand factor type A (vWA) domain